MEIAIENHRENKLDGTIRDVRDGVKELQLCRTQLSFPFEAEIFKVITETQCVLYDHFNAGRGCTFWQIEIWSYLVDGITMLTFIKISLIFLTRLVSMARQDETTDPFNLYLGCVQGKYKSGRCRCARVQFPVTAADYHHSGFHHGGLSRTPSTRAAKSMDASLS
jgi:hypothetical protein